MKVVKRIFYGLMALVIALCAMILLCAVNPNLSNSVKTILYGNENIPGVVNTINTWFGKNTADADNDSNGSNVADNSEIADVVDIPGVGQITTIPSSAPMLTGYQPVESDEEKITDAVAEEIKKTLSTGETGEKLAVDANMYPYFAMLNADEQSVYKQILANAEALNSSFAPVKTISTSQLKTIFEAVINDHPELFYLATGYSVKYSDKNSVIEIKLSYYTIANDISSAKTKFENAAKEILAEAQKLDGDYAKEKYVHDALVERIVYDEGATMNQSAYSALVNGRTVCAGYARANQYLLQKLGIPCYYCTGYSGEDHAWNIVKLSDGYYNEDTTWDDTDPSTYDYFNKTDSDIANTHVRTGMSVNLPRCEGTLYRGLESGSTPSVPTGNAEDYQNTTTHIKPMRYEEEYPSKSETQTTTPTLTDEQKKAAFIAAVKELGYKETDGVWTLDEYYADCKKKLTAAGSGDQHFWVIVDDALFSKIEDAYGNKSFEKGYMKDSLTALGMTEYALQIQAQRLGKSGLYKLYHNVVTWKVEEPKKETTDTTNTTTSEKVWVCKGETLIHAKKDCEDIGTKETTEYDVNDAAIKDYSKCTKCSG